MQNKHFSQKQLNSLMLLMMSVCHECLLTEKGEYQGSSPDEITLVTSSANMGYKFISNNLNNISISINNHQHSVRLEQLFEFDSDRKRMSVIVSHECLGEDRLLICKGADNIIEQRSINTNNKIKDYVTQFSKKGLRTLLFSYRLVKKE